MRAQLGSRGSCPRASWGSVETVFGGRSTVHAGRVCTMEKSCKSYFFRTPADPPRQALPLETRGTLSAVGAQADIDA